MLSHIKGRNIESERQMPSRCRCRCTTTGMWCAHVLSDLQNVHRQKYTFGLVFLHLLSRDWSKVMWVKSWTKNQSQLVKVISLQWKTFSEKSSGSTLRSSSSTSEASIMDSPAFGARWDFHPEKINKEYSSCSKCLYSIEKYYKSVL